MKKTSIPYQQTGYFSKLILDYLEDKKELKPFYNQKFDITSFKTIIEERKKFPVNREVLSNKLLTQYARIGAPDEVQLNIQNLKNENCYTVTTGHQLSLFTGPLYFIYKIITTINLAKALKKSYPLHDFVPVYWMASEDHDFDEINHFNLFGKKYELEQTQTGAVGKMNLDGIEALMTQMRHDLSNRTGCDEALNLFSKYYTPDQTYAQATRGLLNELFGQYGLVIINADDDVLKGLFINELKNELLTDKNTEQINSTSKKLNDLGYSSQVTPREINVFYITENIRERIVRENGIYKVVNTNFQFSEAEILGELKEHPERFSPNVVLRPLYQEKILPNLAYIGGGGELAYWFQLKEIFSANRISYPILVLRNSVLFIDKGSMNKLDKLEFFPSDVFLSQDDMIASYLKKIAAVNIELTEEKKSMATIYDEIVRKIQKVDPSLVGMIKADLQKNMRSLEKVEHRLLKAEKQREEVVVNQIKNLKEKLFPLNGLQERHDTIFSLMVFYGVDVIRDLMNKIEPGDNNFTILTQE